MLGELDVVELAGSERADDPVEPREDRDTSDFEMPELIPTAATRSSTARVDSADVGLHHERVEGLVDPTSQLEDRREPTHARSIIASRSALGRAALPALCR